MEGETDNGGPFFRTWNSVSPPCPTFRHEIRVCSQEILSRGILVCES
jgi:hypothetical protein